MSPIEESKQSAAESPAGLDRRRFLAIVSASVAAASSGCSRLSERGEIVPYRVQPEGVIPGISRAYASSLPSYPHAPAIVVLTREGRPVKIEGNPEHPSGAGGATDVYSQAATLDLYDPDRLGKPWTRGRESNWQTANTEILSGLRHAAPDRQRILLITPALVSPTARSVVDQFRSVYGNADHLTLEMFHPGEALRGRQKAFGQPSLATVNWAKARAILSCECDFLGTASRVADHAGFAARRRPENGEMSRLWVAEGAMTSTGAKADHRLQLRPSAQPRLLLWLLAEMARRGSGAFAASPEIRSLFSEPGLSAPDVGLPAEMLQAMLSDLLRDPAGNCVLAGEQLPWYAHTLAAAVNWSLGNDGVAMASTQPSPAQLSVSTPEQWSTAVEKLARGEYGVVLCMQTNPVYGLSPDLGFVPALQKASLVVCGSLFPSETTARSHWRLPAAHDLECWGDNDQHPGFLTLQQPALLPLFESRQWEQMLLAWLPENKQVAPDYSSYMKARWQTGVYPATSAAADFDRFWQAALHDGFIRMEPAQQPTVKEMNQAGLAEAVSEALRVGGQDHDVMILPGSRTYDGRFANNGWLQELPNPVTTQVWGNGAIVSRKTAERLRCQEGDLVDLNVEGRSVTLPILVEPGIADAVVVVESGYGRREAGSVGSSVGFDPSPLRKNSGGISPWLYTGVTARAAGRSTTVVRVQEHYETKGRSMVQEVDAAGWPNLRKVKEGHRPAARGSSWQYKGHKWGLAVDLSACTGCGACTVACVAENNIPVVGAEQVRRGREMHWIRLDRYYLGSPDNPRVVHQPMMCQQCDFAPCEKVCPVAATVHSPEGLDEMVYNRCVGTRYCANNCPYKVRRFNFLDYHVNRSPAELIFNPEVTVRRRGVMEKCTFCVQRIAAARLKAKTEGRSLQDGDIRTACQQACPAGAIVFGDLNDPASRVHKLATSPRGYLALGELGVQPAVTYLSVTRNPFPGLKI